MLFLTYLYKILSFGVNGITNQPKSIVLYTYSLYSKLLDIKFILYLNISKNICILF